jgi:hypothetical protein
MERLKRLQTARLESVCCTDSLISDLGSLLHKYKVERIMKASFERIEIFTAPREIHTTTNKPSKCEVNVLQAVTKRTSG